VNWCSKLSAIVLALSSRWYFRPKRPWIAVGALGPSLLLRDFAIGQSQSYITTDSQSVCLGVEPNLGLLTTDLFLGQVRVRVTLWLTVSQYVLVSSPISDNWPEFAFSLKFHLDSYRFVIL
jgi:hypothetical protein